MNLLVTLLTLALFSFNSFAAEALSCQQVYEYKMISKGQKKKVVGRIVDITGVTGLVAFAASTPVAIGLLVPTVALGIYSEIDSREAKVLSLIEEGSYRLVKLTKKLQSEVDHQITYEDVMTVVQAGLDSGDFCPLKSAHFRPKEVIAYVTKKLKAKYKSAQ